MGFQKAVKKSAKLRMALIGASGTGKTYTALTLAAALANGQPVAVLDTERGSASKYADLFDFDVLELNTFHPSHYVQAIQDAVAGGYAVIVIDSLSHAWYGTSGMLELVAKQGKTFDAWSRVKPIENALLDALTGSPIHIIATMRSKVAYEVEKDPNTGKATPRKVGTAAIQREGIEYEFDIAGELDQGNTLTISKSRCPALAEAVIAKPGKQVAATLAAWLSGEAPADPPAPTPAPARVTQAARDEPETENATPVPTSQWETLKQSMRDDLGLMTVAQAKAFMRSSLKRDLAGAIPTQHEYDTLCASVERAIAQKHAATRKLARTASRPGPEPAPDELAAAQADYDASHAAQDFPSPANDYDLSKLEIPAVRP